MTKKDFEGYKKRWEEIGHDKDFVVACLLRIAELEMQKTCEGCEHLIIRSGKILDCSISDGNVCKRWIGWSDYYTPKGSE